MTHIGTGTLVGPYVVTKTLEDGQGGMAQLYVARLSDAENIDGSWVALKVTKTVDQGSPEEREHLQELYYDALNNEVEILRKLKHPNIVRLFPVQTGLRSTPYIARANEITGRPWFCVMEYLAGGSLAGELDRARGGHLPIKMAVEIAYQIALALEYIHLKGVAHLDIKPDNVLFREALVPNSMPQVALIDFGIARREKQTGLPAGAASYMSPERIMLVRGELKKEQVTDQRPADVYSLGILLYRSVTGKLPFSRRDKSTTTEVILKEEPVPASRYLKEVPPSLEDILIRCLQKDPAKRATVPDILAALDEAVSPPRWTSAKPKAVEKGQANSARSARRGTSVLAGGLGCLGGLVVGGLAVFVILASVFGPSLVLTMPDMSTAIPTRILWTPTTNAPVIGTPIPAPPTVTPFPTYTPIPQR